MKIYIAFNDLKKSKKFKIINQLCSYYYIKNKNPKLLEEFKNGNKNRRIFKKIRKIKESD